MVRYCQNPEHEEAGAPKRLTGKQRMWCSDACRKKIERASRRAIEHERVNRPRIVRESSDFTRRIRFRLTVDVEFVGRLKPSVWDDGMVDKLLRFRIADKIKGLLQARNPDWKITLRVESKNLGEDRY